MKRIPFIFVLLVILFSLSVYPASASNASGSFASTASGNAFGDFTSIVTSLAKTTSGPTAPVSLGCNQAPTTVTNSASISSGQMANSGSAQTMVTSSRTATSASVQASSDIQNLSLLSGSITANKIHVAVSSTATTTGATSANNSTFSGLTVAGLSEDPAPNTRKDLPGIGYVILNEQYGPVNGSSSTSIRVNAIDVHITLGLLAGSEIVIGSASSGETRTVQPAVVGAYAYGLYANGLTGPGSTSIGPVSPAGIGCTGGSVQNSASGFDSPNISNSGGVSSSAYGQITPSDANAASQTTLSNIDLLAGLISAEKVTVTANADWNGAGSRSGSMTLTYGKANGTSLSRSPSPNTRIDLPELGYVIVNERYGSNNATGGTEDVIAFDIHITVSDILGLENGSRIIIGFATASASSY